MFWPSTSVAADDAPAFAVPATSCPWALSVMNSPRCFAVREMNSAIVSPYWIARLVKGCDAPLGGLTTERPTPSGAITDCAAC